MAWWEEDDEYGGCGCLAGGANILLWIFMLTPIAYLLSPDPRPALKWMAGAVLVIALVWVGWWYVVARREGR